LLNNDLSVEFLARVGVLRGDLSILKLHLEEAKMRMRDGRRLLRYKGKLK